MVSPAVMTGAFWDSPCKVTQLDLLTEKFERLEALISEIDAPVSTKHFMTLSSEFD